MEPRESQMLRARGKSEAASNTRFRLHNSDNIVNPLQQKSMYRIQEMMKRDNDKYKKENEQI